MYRAVLLDVYGTLVHDDDEPVTEICARVAELAGVPIAAVAGEWWSRLCDAADRAYGDAFRRLRDLNLDTLAEVLRHFEVRAGAAELCREQLEFWRRPPLFEDGATFLREAGLPVCLVSDADRADLEAVLALHGITVAAVVTSEDARAYKPRPEPFRLALARLGLDAAEVVHVGDSPASDIAGAAALGIDTAFLRRTGRHLPAELTATHTVTSLAALLPRLRAGA